MKLLKEVKGIASRSDYLTKAREIKEWVAASGGTKPPSISSKNEEERRLGKNLSIIRYYFINSYIRLETEEERAKFRQDHPEIDEVLEIVNEIDKNNTPVKLLQAREIKEWINASRGTKPPSQRSKDEEEQRLGKLLSNIRYYLIKPYLKLETEEERAKFREEHPEIDEVLEIVNEIDQNNTPTKLLQARAIKEWMEKSERTRQTSTKSKDEEEKRLGVALNTIRTYLIRPYMQLETEEERAKFRQDHPETDEVLKIISELDMTYGNKRQQKLAALIRQDLEKRKALEEAKKLEKDYEQQLLIKKGKMLESTQKQGVDYNE